MAYVAHVTVRADDAERLEAPRSGELEDPYRDVAGALHDVSNALTVVLGWIAQSRSPDATKESIEYALSVVEQRARAARDLARRAIGAVPEWEGGDSDAKQIITEAIQALSVEAQRARVRVHCPGPVDARFEHGSDVSQILTNLLLNAFAYSPANSNVWITASVTAANVIIDVLDEGPGVDDARAEAVFRGDSKRQGGAGVGLRHARALARAAGGELELVRNPEEKGARFRLTWLRSDPPKSATSRMPPAVSVLQGTRILVLEDDRDVATLLESALDARGATVTVAHDVDQLRRATDETHDAALIDLSPIADDVQGAIDQLRKGSPNCTLVFISGSAVGVPDALSHGVRWVRKPFEVSEIVAALTEAREKNPKG